FLRCVEDRGAVLGSDIRTLPVLDGRIVVFPENSQEVPVRNAGRIIGHLDGLRMPGGPGTHLFVRRVLRRAAAVADEDVGNAGHGPESAFHAPEAPSRE